MEVTYRLRIQLPLILDGRHKKRTKCVCVIISVCLILAAVWRDLGLFAVSFCSGIPASCKIKRKMAHVHNKSEIAGPQCTLCVLRVPHCSKKALQQGYEVGWAVLCKTYVASRVSLFSQWWNISVDKLQMRCSLFFFFFPFYLCPLDSCSSVVTPLHKALRFVIWGTAGLRQ